MKARKHKAQDVPAKDGTYFVTYRGSAPVVTFMDVEMPHGVAVAVPDAVAERLASNSYFEVSRGNAG